MAHLARVISHGIKTMVINRTSPAIPAVHTSGGEGVKSGYAAAATPNRRQPLASWIQAERERGEGVPIVNSYMNSTGYIANYRSFIDSLFLLFVFNEGVEESANPRKEVRSIFNTSMASSMLNLALT